jgi:hypothetical protein
MDPENRMLKQVTIENAAEADYVFSMLMGEDVGPRREFIEECFVCEYRRLISFVFRYLGRLHYGAASSVFMEEKRHCRICEKVFLHRMWKYYHK